MRRQPTAVRFLAAMPSASRVLAREVVVAGGSPLTFRAPGPPHTLHHFTTRLEFCIGFGTGKCGVRCGVTQYASPCLALTERMAGLTCVVYAVR